MQRHPIDIDRGVGEFEFELNFVSKTGISK